MMGWRTSRSGGWGGLLLLGWLALAPLGALAAGPALEITADSLEMDEKRHAAVFRGDVVAVEGALTLKAERMTVNYQGRDAGNGVQEVREVHARGQVVITQGDAVGHADEARYQVGEDRLELISTGGRPATVSRGDERLQGQRIILHLAPDRTIRRVQAEGGGTGGRVSARILPSGGVVSGGDAGTRNGGNPQGEAAPAAGGSGE